MAEVWSVAVLASMVAILCGGLFLSLSYHYLLWIFMAFAAALFLCIHRHDPDFEIPVRALDVAYVSIINIVIFILLHVFLRYKGF